MRCEIAHAGTLSHSIDTFWCDDKIVKEAILPSISVTGCDSQPTNLSACAILKLASKMNFSRISKKVYPLPRARIPATPARFV